MVEKHHPTRQEIVEWLAEKFSTRLEISPNDIDIDTTFTDYGIDSTEVLVLVREFEKWIGIELSLTAMWYYPTISKLSDHIVSVLESENTI